MFGRERVPSVGALTEEQVARAHIERAGRIARAWAAYEGRLPARLKRSVTGYDDNVEMNYIRPIVNKGVSYLFGSPIAMMTEDEDAAETIRKAWSASTEGGATDGGLALWQDLALNGAVAGHAWLRVRKAFDGEYPSVTVVDPANVSVLASPEDYTEVVEYRITWNAVDPATGHAQVRRQVIVPGKVSGWEIIDQVAYRDQNHWTELQREVWPWSTPPLLGCKNLPAPNRYYGEPEVSEDVISAQESINFLMSNTMRIIRLHAHPRTWGTGFRADAIDTAPDRTLALPANSTLQNLEMQSDLGSSLATLEKLLEGLHGMARVPQVATGSARSVQALSGAALRIMYEPLMELTDTKRQRYGPLIIRTSNLMLEMMGREPVDDLSIQWPDVAPKDRKADAEAAVLEQQAGVSQKSTVRGLGYDPDVEALARAEEQKASMENSKDAASALGLALSRGTLTT